MTTKNTTACIYFLSGECKAGDECAYVHTKERPVCKMFQIGKCNFGYKCFNKHEEEAPKQRKVIHTKTYHTRKRQKTCKICGYEFISMDENIKCQSCLDEVMKR